MWATTVTPTNFVKDAMESSLGAFAIFPPHPTENDFELFRALEVKLDDDTGRVEFTPLGFGIDEKFLREWGMHQKIEALRGFINCAKKEQPETINQSVDFKETSSGDVVVKQQQLRDRDTSNANVLIKEMKETSIIEQKNDDDVGDFLTTCVPAFCNKSSKIRNGLEIEGNNQGCFDYFDSENIEYGLAFVTSYITGSIDVASCRFL